MCRGEEKKTAADGSASDNVPWTFLADLNAHPNGDNNGEVHFTVRRWESPVAQTVDVTYRGQKANNNCGNGTPEYEVEECDNGVNDGSYGTCNSDCTLALRCGDGPVPSSRRPRCPACRCHLPDARLQRN